MLSFGGTKKKIGKAHGGDWLAEQQSGKIVEHV